MEKRTNLERLSDTIERVEWKLRELEVEARSRRMAKSREYLDATTDLRRQLHAAKEVLQTTRGRTEPSKDDAPDVIDRIGQELRAAFEVAYQRFKRTREILRTEGCA